MVKNALTLGLACAAQMAAQSITVHSEFRRVNGAGEIVGADLGGRPREILSPALPRQAFSSFRLVVTTPPGARYQLHLGANPEGILRTTLYRERGTRLDRVDVPYTGKAAAGETDAVAAFWLDVYVPSQTPVQRVRLEAQLNVGDHWVIYPMEARVEPAVVPKPAGAPFAAAPHSSGAVETALLQLEKYLCGRTPRAAANEFSARSLAFRNARQDVALAQAVEARQGREKTVAGILLQLGAADLKNWCAERPKPFDPEAYLRVRDFLVRNAVN